MRRGLEVDNISITELNNYLHDEEGFYCHLLLVNRSDFDHDNKDEIVITVKKVFASSRSSEDPPPLKYRQGEMHGVCLQS